MLSDGGAGVLNSAGRFAELGNDAEHTGVAQFRVVYFNDVFPGLVVRVFDNLGSIVDRAYHAARRDQLAEGFVEGMAREPCVQFVV